MLKLYKSSWQQAEECDFMMGLGIGITWQYITMHGNALAWYDNTMKPMGCDPYDNP